VKTNVLPNVFVWTKIGDDSGQGIQAILNRKELERQAANKFWWGVGRSIRPQIRHLLTRDGHPEVIFSEMPSTAHDRDRNPDGVLLWEKYVTPTRPESLPEHVVVISRAHDSNGKRKDKYYALVCENPLGILRSGGGSADLWALRNLLTGKSLAGQQIAAVVEHIPRNSPVTAMYPVTARAVLAAPHFVQLTGERELTQLERQLLDDVSLEGKTVDDWKAFAAKLRSA
jgi:hypothetical protein